MSRTGIRERRVAAAHETTASMAAVAALRAIRTAGIDARRHRPDPRSPRSRPTTGCPRRRPWSRRRSATRAPRRWTWRPPVPGSSTPTRRPTPTSPAGMAKHVLVIGAELLTRFLDYTDRSTCILFGDGAGAVVLSASDEPGGALGIEMTTEPQGAYMIWLPAGGAKSPPSAETDRPRRALRPDGGQGDLPVRDPDARRRRRWRRSSAPASSPRDIDLFIPHQANIRIIEAVAKGLDLPMDRMFVNLDRYGNTSAASVPIALAEAVNEGRVTGRRQHRHRRVRGRIHVRRGHHRVDRRPGARDRRRRCGRPGRHHGPAPGRLGLGRPDPGRAGRADARSRPGRRPARRCRPRRAGCRPTGGRTRDRSVRQDGPRDRWLARHRAGDRDPARDQGADVAFTYKGNAEAAAEAVGDRSRASAGRLLRSRATRHSPTPPRPSSSRCSRRSARSTSSSTTPASPATT